MTGAAVVRRGSGYLIDSEDAAKIKKLLAETDLSMGDIAKRMDLSTTSIVTINHDHAIRVYTGHVWVVARRQVDQQIKIKTQEA